MIYAIVKMRVSPMLQETYQLVIAESSTDAVDNEKHSLHFKRNEGVPVNGQRQRL